MIRNQNIIELFYYSGHTLLIKSSALVLLWHPRFWQDNGLRVEKGDLVHFIYSCHQFFFGFDQIVRANSVEKALDVRAIFCEKCARVTSGEETVSREHRLRRHSCWLVGQKIASLFERILL